MRMGGKLRGLCRPSGSGLGLCHYDNARRAMGTDLVSGRSSRNRSTRNQQLPQAFSREHPLRLRLTRRDENGWEVWTAVPWLRDWAGLVPLRRCSARNGDRLRFAALPPGPFDEESTTYVGIFERAPFEASPHPLGRKWVAILDTGCAAPLRGWNQVGFVF